MKTTIQFKTNAVFLFLGLAAGLMHTAAIAQGKPLASASGHTFGISLSDYTYDEPGVMTLKSQKIGFDYAGTYVFPSLWPQVNTRRFLRGELRYATGPADYTSPISGILNNTENWYVEARGLFGSDFDMGSFVLAPYAGLGFRYLHHDLRGVTSTGQSGYRRDTSYTSASIGLTHKIKFDAKSQLHSTVEYMHLLQGQHKARLADMGGVFPNISMDQERGYGLRLSSIWRFDTWSIGPTFTYWNIEQSQSVNAGGRTWIEPKNNTTEIGLKLGFHY